MDERVTGDADVALWMLAQLRAETQNEVRRRLALRVNPPAAPVDDRLNELELVAELLRGAATRPGWSFPYLPRKRYDAVRSNEFPSSASLVASYGSWVSVCQNAHRMLASDTRRVGLHRSQHRRARQGMATRYTREDATTALQECARALGRAPSSNAYNHWRATIRQRRRMSRSYPCAKTISVLYSDQGGWIAALEDAGLCEPPAMTVRAVVENPGQAEDLALALLAKGCVVAHRSNRRSVEVRGTIASVARVLANAGLATAPVKLWEPRSRRHCGLRGLASSSKVDSVRPVASEPTLLQ
jgi:hypothetical protein